MAGVVAVAGAAQWRRGRGDGVVVEVFAVSSSNISSFNSAASTVFLPIIVNR